MKTPFAGYDVIGDVHGCADALETLLGKLGYSKRAGVYQYHNQRRPRQVLFLGDLLDRGPKIRESVLIAQDMMAHGHARVVMGNHEYHALGYTTPARAGTGKTYLREHNPRHTALIQQTLEQFANHPADWRDTLRWLYQLPLFLDFGHFRVVHACWDQALIDRFRAKQRSDCIDEDFLHASSDPDTFEHLVMKRLTRGMDMLLPNGLIMTSAEGYKRRFFRIKFWSEDAQTYGDLEFQPDTLPPEVASISISDQLRRQLCLYDRAQPPLFIGHYWQDGRPRAQQANVACLDYSAVIGGRLVAYRMDTETHIQADKFVWVDGLLH